MVAEIVSEREFITQGSKCCYPGCKLDYKLAHPTVVSNEIDSLCEIPLCTYHYYIIAGNHFTCAMLDEEKMKFEFEGPFEQVELIEQVFGAKEIMRIMAEKKCKAKV